MANTGKHIAQGFTTACEIAILVPSLLALFLVPWMLVDWAIHFAEMQVGDHIGHVVLTLISAGLLALVFSALRHRFSAQRPRLPRWTLRDLTLHALERQRSRLVRTLEEKLRDSRQCGYRKPGITLPRQLAHLRIETLPDSVRREELDELETLDCQIADLRAARLAPTP